ncbi:MAG: hypothetical protein WDN76_10555 [Alphaproteobacteria bacterium]
MAASAYINPMTALGFTELMKLEGYKALVHTGGGFKPRPDAG